MKEMRIIKDVRSSDVDNKLLFQLGLNGTEKFIIVKQKGNKKRYCVPLKEVESAFKKSK